MNFWQLIIKVALTETDVFNQQSLHTKIMVKWRTGNNKYFIYKSTFLQLKKKKPTIQLKNKTSNASCIPLYQITIKHPTEKCPSNTALAFRTMRVCTCGFFLSSF